MPLFRTLSDILKTNAEELHDENHKNYDFLTLPPSPVWNGPTTPTIEDIDIWEVIFEGGGGVGLYAAWCPYAHFFMFKLKDSLETYYGPIEEKLLEQRLDTLNLSYPKEK
jgi:hypothetical protein